MRRTLLSATILAACVLALVVFAPFWPVASQAEDAKASGRLCVVWTSSDPGVAKNVCFMYAHNAKRRAWFDVVHLIVWGPSAKLLAESPELQAEIKAMQASGLVIEACVACAKNYGVVEKLQSLDIDVKPMGAPLTERLKGDWKVLTF